MARTNDKTVRRMESVLVITTLAKEITINAISSLAIPVQQWNLRSPTIKIVIECAAFSSQGTNLQADIAELQTCVVFMVQMYTKRRKTTRILATNADKEDIIKMQRLALHHMLDVFTAARAIEIQQTTDDIQHTVLHIVQGTDELQQNMIQIEQIAVETKCVYV
ncbi:hypothetical protein BDQ17DRAFT_1415740 [Cyathus striatus]|nr:hypothetical protein BDQ17DRAFT_1415740 [Cyathus striatus]